MPITTIKQLQDKKKGILKDLSDVEDQIKDKLKKTPVQCTYNPRFGEGCGMGFTIDSLDYIQTYWYKSPHGCMGGDSWRQGEGNFICPNCKHRNRLYDKPEIVELKHLFKSVKDEHNKDY